MTARPAPAKNLLFPKRREIALWLADGAEPFVRSVAVGMSGLYSREGVELRLRGLAVGAAFSAETMRVGARCRFVSPENMAFGPQVTFYGNAYVNAFGSEGRLDVGAETHFDVGCVLYAQGGLTIGRRCAVAAGVTIYSQSNRDDHPELGDIMDQGIRRAPVVIGDGVWVGARAVILPGITIADRATIAAGAVVTRNVMSGTTVAGVPARVLNRLAPRVRD